MTMSAESQIILPPPSKLGVIAFNNLIKCCWRNSGVMHLFVDYAYDTYSKSSSQENLNEPNSSPSMTLYFKVIKDIADGMLQWHLLPKTLRLELGNAFLDFDSNIRDFSMMMAQTLVKISREKVKYCVENVVVTPAGDIDRQKTIFKLCYERDIEFMYSLSAYHCVGEKVVNKILKEMEPERKALISIEENKSYCNPDSFWELACSDSNVANCIFIYVGGYGPMDAIEYFFETIDLKSRDKELARAAAYMMSGQCTAEKLYFFYRHMSEKYWLEFVKRNFYEVFKEFFYSRKHRRMCLVIFNQIHKYVDAHVHLWVLDFISGQFVDNHPGCCKHNLKLFDAEYILWSVWKTVPVTYKKRFANKHIYSIINKLLLNYHYSLISYMIDNEAYNSQQKNHHISAVVMSLIVQEKVRDITIFINKFHPKTRMNITGMFTYDNIKRFITFSDHCRNVDKYDRILSRKYATSAAKMTFKEHLRKDRSFIAEIVDDLKDNTIHVSNVHRILMWLHNDNIVEVYRYICWYMIPENFMSDLFYNHLVGSRKNFSEISGYSLTQKQIESIRVRIESNKERLYDHCAVLLLENDYRPIRNLLACVFNNDFAREIFLVSFFQSEQGVKSLYRLIVEDTHIDDFICASRFGAKLRMFLSFKKYWMSSDAVSIVIDKVLQTYGHPNGGNFLLKLRKNFVLLPHENCMGMRVITDACYRVMRCLLVDHAIVDGLKGRGNFRYAGLDPSQVTNFSVLLGVMSRVDVPVIL